MLNSWIFFGSVFYGIIKLVGIYRSELLLGQGISEQEFSTIFAILTIFSGIPTAYSRKFHKKFRNKTITVISLMYITACIIAAMSVRCFTENIAIPIIIGACAIFKICDSLWCILEYKYLKNFTTEKMRNKIMFTYEAITCIIASIISLLGSLLLEITNINNAFLLTSLIFLIMIVLILDYMRTRIGLRPNEYKEEEIRF